MKAPTLIKMMKTVTIGAVRDGMLSLRGIINPRVVRPILAVCLLVGALAAVTPVFAADPQLYKDSVDALYNLDFSTAENGFESLTRQDPANPVYWNGLASMIWSQIMYDQQKLNIDSFSGSTLGTKNSRDAVDPAAEKRLRETIAIAIEKASAILKKNPNDVEALYALGISNATLAIFEATAKRSYTSALGKAKTARNLHQDVLKLNPSFDDARMSIGAYDYVVSVLPFIVRIALRPFGISGNGKEAGIRAVEAAAAKGQRLSIDAQSMLVVIYSREKRYDDALRLVSELHSRYPRNFVFELSRASLFAKMKRWDDSVHVYEQILEKIDTKKDGYERLRSDKIYYELGNSNIQRSRSDEAISAFNHVVNSKEAGANEKAGSYIWLGKIYDGRNERMKALEQYNAVLQLSCDAGYKEEARRLKQRPFIG
jgi:tetratricopeptide (TPR) repeat protein